MSMLVHISYAETFTISYTDIPEKIKVALTGYYDKSDWIKKGKGKIREVIEVDFKEYVKDVVGFEWNLSKYDKYKNDDEQTPGVMDYQKAAASAVKMTAWWKINLLPYENNKENKESRHQLPGHPDILDNTFDHAYITHDCRGENTSLCKGLTSYREIGDFRDRAVDATWTTILKRKDCVYLDQTCPNNATLGGCTATGKAYASLCMPQIESREEAKTISWTEILTKYYKTSALLPPAFYEQSPLQSRHTVEALSSCIPIQEKLYDPLHDSEKFALYRCKALDGIHIVKLHYPQGSNIPKRCEQGNTENCPLGDHYINVGTKGVIVDIKEKVTSLPVATELWNVTETWLKVKWRVKPGFELDTGILTPGNDLVGWVQDKDIRPVGDGVSPLVQVRITGATVKP